MSELMTFYEWWYSRRYDSLKSEWQKRDCLEAWDFNGAQQATAATAAERENILELLKASSQEQLHNTRTYKYGSPPFHYYMNLKSGIDSCIVTIKEVDDE